MRELYVLVDAFVAAACFVAAIRFAVMFMSGADATQALAPGEPVIAALAVVTARAAWVVKRQAWSDVQKLRERG